MAQDRGQIIQIGAQDDTAVQRPTHTHTDTHKHDMDCDISQADLLRTADELYRRMEQPHFGSDDAYWSSLPVHLRNFIRNALPLAGNLAVLGNGSGTLPGGVLGAGGQRAMYALAQSIVGAANEGMGGSPDAATLMPPPPSVPTGAKSRSPSYQGELIS